jgi:4'-phosphopantetheinyl transferase
MQLPEFRGIKIQKCFRRKSTDVCGEDLLDRFDITAGRVWFFYMPIEQRRDTRRISYAFLKKILARCTGSRAEAVRFTQNRYGKPELAPGVTDQPVRFTLSHTGELAVCAVTLAHDIGVDVEHLERPVNLSIANRFFSNQEAEAISRVDASLKQPLFFRFWTLKEAYAKATGRGLAIGLDQFSFVLDRPEIRVMFHSPDQDDPAFWQFVQFSPVPGYMTAVAVNKKTGPPLTLSVHPWVWD